MRLPAALISAMLWMSCGSDADSGAVDASPPSFDSAPDAAWMNSLRGTGLWSDFENEMLAPTVRPYRPQFELWSDGAVKRRWFSLPDGEVIDTSNMDSWVFPVGTKMWKEFSRDDVRVETRLIEKTDVATWSFENYLWNADGSEALLDEELNGHDNYLGTFHDVPGPDDCNACHGRTTHVLLGFGAVQLDWSAQDGMVTIDTLDEEGLLSVSPPGDSVPHYPLPGTAIEQAALGYVHANCSNCHNTSPLGLPIGTPVIDFQHSVATTEFANTGLAATVGQTAERGVVGFPDADTVIDAAGDPQKSAAYARMTQAVRGKFGQMPLIGTELEDPVGLSAMAAWIESLAL